MAADELITRAVHDHVEGWCDADAGRMDRALQPGLDNRAPAEDDTADLTEDLMLQACAEGEGTRAADWRLQTGVADVCGGIAGAVAGPARYREYLHLISTGDGWKIAGALWPPQ